jgi:hypothetical protein
LLFPFLVQVKVVLHIAELTIPDQRLGKVAPPELLDTIPVISGSIPFYQQNCPTSDWNRCPLRPEGQWRAHGRYIARESAAERGDAPAFNSREELRPDLNVVQQVTV